MNTIEYAEYDGLGLAGLVERAEVSPQELAAVALEAHAATAAELGAVIEVYEAARSRPLEAFAGGPFRGVPFLVKDVGSFAGLRTEFCSRLGQGRTVDHDDAYAQMIRGSGVNLVGRTSTPEFSMAASAENRLYGSTSNPWRKGYSTNGSSGGSAAAVAAGVVPIAHASDIGGSTRGPAAWCGTVGLHPSRGRVSAAPDESEDGYGMCQSSVLTRTVRDTAAMLDCISVPQPGDPYVIAGPPRPYLEHVGCSSQRLRIGFSAEPLMDAPVDPEVAAAVERVAGVLDELGHEVVAGAPAVDLAAIDRVCLDVWFHDFDRWLDEVAADTGRVVGPDTVEAATLRYYHYARGQHPRQFLDALEEMNVLRRRVGQFFAADAHDIWLTPTCAQVAPPNGTFSMDVDLAPLEFITQEQRSLQFLSVYNVTGQPAISLPLAQHSSGLPIGVQLGARPAQEHVLIELASALEEALPWRDRRPELHVSNLVGPVGNSPPSPGVRRAVEGGSVSRRV